MRNTSARARVDNAHPFRSSLTSSIKPPRAFLSFLQTRSSLLSHAAIFPPSRLLVRIKIFTGKRDYFVFFGAGIDQGWSYWTGTWVSYVDDFCWVEGDTTVFFGLSSFERFLSIHIVDLYVYCTFLFHCRICMKFFLSFHICSKFKYSQNRRIS